MNINKISGRKWRKEYFNSLIEPHLPNDISIYVEPFAGSFSVGNFIENRPGLMVYNDINKYDGIDLLDIDYITHYDYKECIRKWDGVGTTFYLDPPYFGKEDWYNGLVNDKDFHIELRNTLESVSGIWLLSYESNPFIGKLYKDFNIYEYEGKVPYIKDILITNGKR